MGLSADKNWEEWVANIARHNVIPGINPLFQKLEIQGKPVGIVTIDKGADRPYQTNRFLYFVRVGSTSRAATQMSAQQMEKYPYPVCCFLDYQL